MNRVCITALFFLLIALGGCAAWSSNPGPSGERAAGAEVASTVSEALMEAGVKGWEAIDLKVEGESLILSGEAASGDEKEKILEIAGEHAGSLKIEDRLSVRAGT